MAEPSDQAESEAQAREVECTSSARCCMVAIPRWQSAVLADLLATWLAGHVNFEDAAATERHRTALLLAHMTLVYDLVKPNADRIMAQHARREAEGIASSDQSR